jgi:methylated-DNA-protein-cysteine methyltransferase-like protein
VLAALKPGEVVSYGEVAARAGNPGAHRAVGQLLAKGQLPNWWRVVRSDGTLAANERGEQARRLIGEGVRVAGGRVADRSRLRAGLYP